MIILKFDNLSAHKFTTNIFIFNAYWLRSSVVSVLFSVTTETSIALSLGYAKKNYNIIKFKN
ncbi:hypothetical protein H8356DRAFT_1334671 [Neocallimastix lanati (nom. inval.)]|nr:hypothetical protein H8356DRAFT_1334671 [Neocallimastix sp. JGI-2020a]